MRANLSPFLHRSLTTYYGSPLLQTTIALDRLRHTTLATLNRTLPSLNRHPEARPNQSRNASHTCVAVTVSRLLHSRSYERIGATSDIPAIRPNTCTQRARARTHTQLSLSLSLSLSHTHSQIWPQASTHSLDSHTPARRARTHATDTRNPPALNPNTCTLTPTP